MLKKITIFFFQRIVVIAQQFYINNHNIINMKHVTHTLEDLLTCISHISLLQENSTVLGSAQLHDDEHVASCYGFDMGESRRCIPNLDVSPEKWQVSQTVVAQLGTSGQETGYLSLFPLVNSHDC